MKPSKATVSPLVRFWDTACCRLANLANDVRQAVCVILNLVC